MKENVRVHNQVHPTENVDRARRHLPCRISCGLRVEDDFSVVNAMLILSRGCGKWMRPTVYRTISVDIPEAVKNFGKQISREDSPHSKDVNLFVADLANVQAEAVNHLLSGSVKVLDNVLATCVEDPGLWTTDFDQKWNYQSLCDPCRLAELTGISVIDALPARDIAVGGDGGGDGGSLAPLPYWLLFADRNSTVSLQTRLLINIDHSTELTLLPPSDGLDSELPAIRFVTLPGLDLFDQISNRIDKTDAIRDYDGRIAVQGKRNDDLVSALSETCLSQSSKKHSRTQNSKQLTTELANLVADFVARKSVATSDALCSVNHFIAAEIGRQIARMDKRLVNRSSAAIGQLIISGSGAGNGLLQQSIGATTEKEIVSSEQYGVAPNDLKLLVTAVLGLMHIDQLPATIPSITGADCPRLLGRLTPGQPANWRRLLMEMADYRPPAMKLREAV